ncbi:ComF family protein [Deinococcus sonorensis]|uniref:Double zinc ribbon domain-containing protein n=2 Tax=Deinococcus sonorensis TaxID=309891 RepID=A0AAU7U859_9DEIO
MTGWLRALLPRRCPGCQRQLGSADGLCPACRGQLRAQVYRRSLLRPDDVPHLVALGPYRGVLGRTVRALKYGGARELAPLLGAALAEGVPAAWQVRAVLHVPMHPARLRQRGYDQAALLAAEVARQLGVPHVTALARVRQGGPQAKQAAEQRRTALQGAFVCRSVPAGALLLLDDVMTTGSTLTACRDALTQAGAGPVYYAVVAR